MPRSIVIALCLTISACMAGAEQAEDSPERAAALRPVGFVTHFHLGSYEELAEAPVTAELCDLIHWRMVGLDEASPRVEDIQPDMTHAEEWLPILEQAGRDGFPIIDTAVHHTNNPWRHAMTSALGESMLGAADEERTFSSLHSPTFRESVFRYVDQMVPWFKEHDGARAVKGYFNGAEWFYPATLDFSPHAMAAFRGWLQAQYEDLDALNTAWGADFAAWDAVDAPRFGPVGAWYAAEPAWTPDYMLDASYASGHIPVTPGNYYEVSAAFQGEGAAGDYASLDVLFHNDAGTHMAGAAATADEAPEGSGRLEERVRAPAGAATAKMLCKLNAPGKVTYRNPQMTAADTGAVLTGSAPEDWKLSTQGDAAGKIRVEDGDLVMHLEGEGKAPRFKQFNVALEDWIVFSYEAMADWLNTCAERIKRHDPTRPVASYVGCVFGQKAQWDLGMMTQRLDISLANSPAIDVNGIQMAIAGDDFTWATHIIDTARKHGKPVWATDLIDFPYGHYSGFQNIYRGTMAAVQHGLDGVFWYCWRGVPDYSYFERLADVDRHRLIRDTRRAIEAVEGYEPAVRAALLVPIMPYTLADEGGRKADMIDSGGFYDLLLDAGMTVDIVTPYEISRGVAGLADYEAVFVSDCPVLPRTAFDKLAAYAANGGRIIGAGRTPAKDLRGEPLPALDADGVVWGVEKLGRPYWGKVHRVQVYGNTPAMLVEAPDPARTSAKRRALRAQLLAGADEAGFAPPVTLPENTGAVHAVPFHNPADDAWLLFLVHTDEGRRHHATLHLNLGETFASAEAWTDFDKRHPVEITDDVVTTPDFAHVCILRLEKNRG